MPGGEATGTFDALGKGVMPLAVGDRVLALTGFGSMAEQVVARAERVCRLSRDMPFDDTDGFGVAYATTSHHALKQRGRLQAGDTSLARRSRWRQAGRC